MMFKSKEINENAIDCVKGAWYCKIDSLFLKNLLTLRGTCSEHAF